ncbi:MAG: MFS transporter [Deltaproteobacteria bacterium]|nr:MFS transporter [Deltaproteobacteria bacterium]MBU54822.1 MFS transporter [Deltaproteobacteria bacterium]|tara:strand:- start:18405 stop:19574 length:1170 start_codon:yes stop_codon:yes gene_type:complete
MGFLALLTLIPVTMPVPVLRGLIQTRFDVSELQTSLFMSINMIGAILGAPLAGMLSDYFGKRKWPIVFALFADAFCFYLLTLDVSFPLFMTFRFFEGVAHIVALSLLLALAVESQSSEKHGRIMGMMGAGITFGVALGAPLGGVMGKHNPLLPIYLGVFINLTTALLSALFLKEIQKRKKEKVHLREIFRTLRGNKWILIPLSFTFIDRFTVGFFTATFSLYMKRIFQLPPPQIGFLLALFLFPFALLSYPFGRISEKTSRSLMLLGGSFVYGLLLLTLGWWTPKGLPYLMLMLGLTSAVMFVPSLVMTTDLASAETKATALGGFNAAGSLGFMLGPITGGWVSQTVAASHGWHTGYTASFIVAGCAELLCVMLALPLLLSLRSSKRTT